MPGGGVEESETFEQTAIREAKEETNLDIEIEKILWDFDDGFGRSKFFLVKNFKGKLKLGGPELEKQNKQDQYILEWVNLKDLKHLLFYPEEIKRRILDTF